MTSTCIERLFAMLGNAVIFFSVYQLAKRKAKVQSSDDHNDKANPVSPVRQPTFWERLFYTAAPVFTLLVIGMILCETIGAWYHLFQSTKRGHDGTVGLFDMLLIHGAWAGGILLFHKITKPFFLAHDETWGGFFYRNFCTFFACLSLGVMRGWYYHHLLHKVKPDEWPSSALPLGDAIMGLLLVFTLPSSIIFPRTRSFQSAFYRTLSTVVIALTVWIARALAGGEIVELFFQMPVIREVTEILDLYEITLLGSQTWTILVWAFYAWIVIADWSVLIRLFWNSQTLRIRDTSTNTLPTLSRPELARERLDLLILFQGLFAITAVGSIGNSSEPWDVLPMIVFGGCSQLLQVAFAIFMNEAIWEFVDPSDDSADEFPSEKDSLDEKISPV